jgi:hypothetical protein
VMASTRIVAQPNSEVLHAASVLLEHLKGELVINSFEKKLTS